MMLSFFFSFSSCSHENYLAYLLYVSVMVAAVSFHTLCCTTLLSISHSAHWWHSFPALSVSLTDCVFCAVANVSSPHNSTVRVQHLVYTTVTTCCTCDESLLVWFSSCAGTIILQPCILISCELHISDIMLGSGWDWYQTSAIVYIKQAHTIVRFHSKKNDHR